MSCTTLIMRRWSSIEDDGPSGGGGLPRNVRPRVVAPTGQRPYTFRSQHPMRQDQYAPTNRNMYPSGPSYRYWTSKKQSDYIRFINELRQDGVMDVRTASNVSNLLSSHYGPLHRSFQSLDIDREALQNLLAVNMSIGEVLYNWRRSMRPRMGDPPHPSGFELPEDIWRDITEYSIPLQRIQTSFVTILLRIKKDLQECINTNGLL